MSQVIFLLGRPGSGKSRTARQIKEAAAGPECRVPGLSLEGWSVLHMTDYEFLQQMFLEDRGKEESLRRFRPTRLGGFDVCDFSVLSLALQRVSASAVQHLYARRTLVLVEFARQNYSYEEVWRHFHREILDGASFLYLEADIETCIRRIEKRAVNRAYPDDQYVSSEIMLSYYGVPSGEPANLRQYFAGEQVAAIENTGLWWETWMEISQFLNRTLARTLAPQRQTVELMLAH